MTGTTQWSFAVRIGGDNAPPLPKSDFLTLRVTCQLEFFSTKEKTKPQFWLSREDQMVVSLKAFREKAEAIFWSFLAQFPCSMAHPENMNTRRLAGRARSYATSAFPLRVSLTAVTVLPSADIERMRHVNTLLEFATTEENGEERCCICLQEWDPEIVVRMPCSHLFHGLCLFRWLKRNRSCPVCRSPVPHTTTTCHSSKS